MITHNHLHQGQWLTREQLGFFMFTRVNLLEKKYKKIIIEMVENFLDIIKPNQPDLFNINSNSITYKRFNEKRLEELKQDFMKFQYCYDSNNSIFDLGYVIDIKKGCGPKNMLGEFKFYVDVNSNINYHKDSYVRSKGTHEIAIFINENLNYVFEISSLIKKYYGLLGCCYGYINPVLSYNPGPHETYSILKNYAKEDEGIFDIPVNMGNNETYETKVKGSQWANFLSETHLKQLGGKKAAMLLLSDFAVEEITSGSLFVKMPFELSIENCQNNVVYYKKLAKIFEPIFISKWHGGDTGVILEGNSYLKRFLLDKEERTHETNKATQFWKEKLEPIMKKMEGKKK